MTEETYPQIGDIVKLKSGSVPMTVNNVTENYVSVVYMTSDRQILRREHVHAQCLVKVIAVTETPPSTSPKTD